MNKFIRDYSRVIQDRGLYKYRIRGIKSFGLILYWQNVKWFGGDLFKMNDKNETNASKLYDIVDIIIGVAKHDPLSVAKIAAFLSDKTYTEIQKIPYLQIKKYLDGVKRIEELGNSCKIADRLFSDPKRKNDNAMRVYRMVTSTDTEKKIDYLIGATRSMLLGLIDTEEMFRIFRAIVDSLPEDLDYLSSIVEKSGPFTGNIQILALERSGLMISAGIDANADVEEQQYHITTLGFMVDRYALSLLNEERWKWYNNKANADNRKFMGPVPISNEEIEAMFNEQRHEIIDSVQPKLESINPDEHFEKIQRISQRREAVALLVCATKAEGSLRIGQDISHSNPYVEIGKHRLPKDDNSRVSAAWIDAVKTLEDTGMLECVNFKHKIYRLTSDGWEKADAFIEQNGLQENDITDPNEIIKILQ